MCIYICTYVYVCINMYIHVYAYCMRFASPADPLDHRNCKCYETVNRFETHGLLGRDLGDERCALGMLLVCIG